MANGRINFFIVIHRFSLVRAAMNAPRIFKLGKNCLTGFDQCAKNASISWFANKYIPSAQQIFTAPI
jgi:hypothetical protein